MPHRHWLASYGSMPGLPFDSLGRRLGPPWPMRCESGPADTTQTQIELE
jgi:hypothetical protein